MLAMRNAEESIPVTLLDFEGEAADEALAVRLPMFLSIVADLEVARRGEHGLGKRVPEVVTQLFGNNALSLFARFCPHRKKTILLLGEGSSPLGLADIHDMNPE